jgi:ferredoxin-NADP reductase
MFGLLGTHRLIFERRRDEEGRIAALRFRTASAMTWEAGQHGLLRLPGGAMKPFSIASAPEEGVVLIGTSLRSNSSYKQQLAALTPGDHAVFHGPVMKFTLDGQSGKIVMLAQGVGITPFRAMLRHSALAPTPGVTITLVHVAADGHAFYADTQGDADSAHYPTGSVTFRETVAEVLTAQPQATYFIAGAGDFVKSTTQMLQEADVDRRRIRRDTYYGYHPARRRDCSVRAIREA